ncbi:glycosyltransferase involved in cell wall biosynthesis [Micromonospora sp. A200]|uniref:glycosyltransferase n=1 Tax=Micromonospora sp. A200 TaxID=2940568 RepID=UPI002475DA5F|nr:glycosyltransferase [Micromonospora sp. A200]MDH6463139.1 glycosyltransferase involved in cell wall biosynthesis [Micromonospora sp. A200]
MARLPLPGRMGKYVAAALFRAIELRLARLGVPLHVVSEDDAGYLRRALRTAGVFAIPVIVPTDEIAAVDDHPIPRDATRRILVFADLRHDHVRLGYEEFMRALAVSDLPKGIQIDILGRVPEIEGLGGTDLGLPINYIEWVDDYRVALRQADLVVLPDRTGTGLKNRTVQALAMGRAVAGTRAAFEGISARDSVHGLICQDPVELASKVAKLICDSALLGTLARQASEATQEFQAHNVARRWIQAYTSLSHGPQSEG